MNDNAVGRFFDALTDEYTEVIERCFPRYREMLWALLDYLPRVPSRVLELGCGTGNLTVLLAESFPAAEIVAVDVAADSLDVCRTRLAGHASFRAESRDFRELAYEDGAFDLVVSSIAIHHLVSAEKVALFREVHRCLAPGGVFAFADQCRGATDDLYARHIANWREQSLAAGATEEEFAMWMEHQRDHDHHDRLTDQLGWLSEAGFPVVDCVWRCLLWSVLQARRD